MDNIPENTNHINYRKNEIINNIINGFVKSQDEDAYEEGLKEEEKTEGALTSEQKQLIKQYIISHPHLDDEDFHKYAMKMGINKHEAEEAVYQMFNEVYSQDRLKELEGGAADNMTADDIAKKHNITLQELQKQINIGLKVEREHTKNEKQALEITLDHLCENAKYYTEAKPENWAEKEIEAEKAIIGELDMLNKALPPTEGEIREYKDGKYRFEGGHWKKIKQEEKRENIFNLEVEKELELKYGKNARFRAVATFDELERLYKRKLTEEEKESIKQLKERIKNKKEESFDYHKMLKILDKITPSYDDFNSLSTQELEQAQEVLALKIESAHKDYKKKYNNQYNVIKEILSNRKNTFTEKEKSNATAAYNWLKKHNMTATSYELNQAAENAVKSGILTPKERELIKKKFEEEKPKIYKKGDIVTYQTEHSGGMIANAETIKLQPKKGKIQQIRTKDGDKQYLVVDGNGFNPIWIYPSEIVEEKPKIEEKKEPTWKDMEMPSGFNLSMNSMYGSGTQIPYIYKEGDDDNYVMIGPDWKNGGERGIFWSIINKEGNTIKKLVKGKEEAIKEAIKSLSSSTKPVAKVIGEDGNVFNLIGICMKALKRAGQPEKAKEMQEKIFAAGSYEEALNIMGEYCDLQ